MDCPDVGGFVKPGFEAVRDAFVENFTRRHELGDACCIYYRGGPVVDIWGGVRTKSTGAPWEQDTMVIVFSTTKGLAGMTIALANSQGLLDYEETVCTYWPEFAQHGKDRVTVRQLLSHQAGLCALAPQLAHRGDDPQRGRAPHPGPRPGLARPGRST